VSNLSFFLFPSFFFLKETAVVPDPIAAAPPAVAPVAAAVSNKL
jgi:hypothetical protein